MPIANKLIDKYYIKYGLIIRYVVAGSIGALINMGVLFILVDLLGMWYLISAIFSFIASLVITFFLQKFWAFRDPITRKKYMKKQAILYTISSTSFLFINILILYILVDVLSMWYLLGQFLSLGVVAVGSFLFNKTVTFKKKEE